MSAEKRARKDGEGARTDRWSWLDIPDGEVLALLLVVIVGWVAVELFAPVLLVAAYALLIGALRRVANDTHGCEHNLARSVGWGAVWATLYTLPLAALVVLLR